MKAKNFTKTIMRFFRGCLKTALMGAMLPVFVVLSSLKETKPQPKPHILSTYSYAKN
ncbi:MAG: hypothetical protein J6A96_03705 [Clostridia bacterium]|nr:hypothetical protein [Clostridia bacterium]